MQSRTFGPHYMGGSIITLKESFRVNFVSCSGIHGLNSVNQMIGMKSYFLLYFSALLLGKVIAHLFFALSKLHM